MWLKKIKSAESWILFLIVKRYARYATILSLIQESRICDLITSECVSLKKLSVCW